ncbi:MAG: UDP-N-acetylglucosamine 2-epimerase [Clostridiaceae bacterium]
MKTIGVVTTSRADFGLLYPIMKEIEKSKELKLKIIVSGLHLLKECGETLENIKKKFNDFDVVDLYLPQNDKYKTVKGVGIGFMSFSEYIKYNKLDLMIVLGDRVELMVPVYSAMICGIPTAHIFGGDSIDQYITYDNNIRHSITKLAHIHFTANENHSKRVEMLGEEKWRIFTVGSPALDYIKNCTFIDINLLQEKFNKINFKEQYAVFTYHPVHLELDNVELQIDTILKCLKVNNLQVICTKPNNDIGSEVILEKIKKEHVSNTKFLLVENISQEEYYSLLKYSSFMIGNSSSGVLESTSFEVPSINIGTRQKGRIQGKNVIDTDYSFEEINGAILKCLDSEFKKKCKSYTNPYGDGTSSKKIVNEIITLLNSDKNLLIKKMTY